MHIAIVALIAVLTSATGPARMESDRDVDGLKGPVKTSIEESIERSDPSQPTATAPRFRERDREYNRAGDLVKERHYQLQRCAGCPLSQLFESVTFYRTPDGRRYESIEEVGPQPPSIATLPPGGGKAYAEFMNSGDGKRVAYSQYNRAGELAYSIKYIFGADGKRIGYVRSDPVGQVNSATIEEVDSARHYARIDQFSKYHQSDNSKSTTWIHQEEYDKYGNWIHRVGEYIEYTDGKISRRLPLEKVRTLTYFQ